MNSSLSPFGEKTQKYWDKRHELFSLWDKGIRTDEEGLFSVKPEKFALETADTLPGYRVLDAFCGIGGSAIAFARRGKSVIAVDVFAERLAMAKHNAEVYGVADCMQFLNADALAICEELQFDALSIEPPWGGPGYSSKMEFFWKDFSPNPMPLIELAVKRGVPFSLGLPLNFSEKAMSALPGCVRIEISQDDVRAYFKTAYYIPA